MMTFAARAVGAVAMALMGVIAAELATGVGTEQVVPDVAPQPPLSAPPPPQERPEHRDQSAARALTALARPLFTLDRRPPGPDAVPVQPLSNPPRLAGTLVSREGRWAIFAAGDKPVVVGEGRRLDIWTVQAIDVGSVTLVGPDGSRVLRTSFAQDGPAQVIQVLRLTGPVRPVRTHSRAVVASDR